MNIRFIAGVVVGFVASSGAVSAAALINAPEKSYLEMDERVQQVALDRLAANSDTSSPEWPGVTIATTGDAATDTLTQRMQLNGPMGPTIVWLSETFAEEQRADFCRSDTTRSVMAEGITHRKVLEAKGEIISDLVATPDICAALSDVRKMPQYLGMTEAQQTEFLALIAERLRNDKSSEPQMTMDAVRADSRNDSLNVLASIPASLNSAQLAAVRAQSPDAETACAAQSAITSGGINFNMVVRDKKGQTVVDLKCKALTTA